MAEPKISLQKKEKKSVYKEEEGGGSPINVRDQTQGSSSSLME